MEPKEGYWAVSSSTFAPRVFNRRMWFSPFMRLHNPSQVLVDWIDKVADSCDLQRKKLLIFLDPEENRVRRDEAEYRIRQNVARGWTPYLWDTETVAKKEDADIHACFAPGELLRTQNLPEYAKTAVESEESLVYIDKVYLADHIIHSVLTLAEECRHAWQYYTHPIVFFGCNVLGFVMVDHETPAEVDAAIFAKRSALEFFGPSSVEKFAREQLNSSPAEHRAFWQRFLDTNHLTKYDCVASTQNALMDKADELRRHQKSSGIDYPYIERTAGYLPETQRVRFLATARR